MKLEDVDASEARALLKRLGLSHMEGSNNPKGEFWLSESAHPYFIPYGSRGADSFVKQAFNEIVDSLT